MINMLLKESKYQNPNSETYWRSKYEINEGHFDFVYELPLRIIIPDTSRFFQYKINTQCFNTSKCKAE